MSCEQYGCTCSWFNPISFLRRVHEAGMLKPLRAQHNAPTVQIRCSLVFDQHAHISGACSGTLCKMVSCLWDTRPTLVMRKMSAAHCSADPDIRRSPRPSLAQAPQVTCGPFRGSDAPWEGDVSCNWIRSLLHKGNANCLSMSG